MPRRARRTRAASQVGVEVGTTPVTTPGATHPTDAIGSAMRIAVRCASAREEPRRPAELLDVPAEHWGRLRTPNPIESVFATARHRIVRTKGAPSQDSARLMAFKLAMATAKPWHRLKGDTRSPTVVQGVTFRNSVAAVDTPVQNAA